MKTNNLKHKILCKDAEGNNMEIDIRLNDECKNGREDFAITGTIYQKDKPKTDRWHIAGGCIHDDILKVRPDLKIFIDLHLADWQGVPMYAVENGFFHLKNGFNKTKPDENTFVDEFCDYYRISKAQYDVLSKSQNKLQYALSLQNLGILTQWEAQAKAAIKLLESMTGLEFNPIGTKTNYNYPSDNQLQEEADRVKNGYYSAEKIKEREDAKIQTVLDDLVKDRDKGIEKVQLEFDVKKQVLLNGGVEALENCIFYTHSKTLSFNWRGYDMISDLKYNQLLEKLVLPDGIKVENKKEK